MTSSVTNRAGHWRCWTRTLATGSALALLSTLAWPAFGQSAMALSTARELAKEGLDAYDAQRFDEAADKLLRAFTVVRVPTLAVNAARALVKVNKPFQASELYLQAMQLVPAPDWQPVQQEMQAVAAQERAALLPVLATSLRFAGPTNPSRTTPQSASCALRSPRRPASAECSPQHQARPVCRALCAPPRPCQTSAALSPHVGHGQAL